MRGCDLRAEVQVVLVFTQRCAQCPAQLVEVPAGPPRSSSIYALLRQPAGG